MPSLRRLMKMVGFQLRNQISAMGFKTMLKRKLYSDAIYAVFLI